MLRYAAKTQKTKPTKPTQTPKEQTIENSDDQKQQLHNRTYFVNNGFADEIASHKNHLDFTKIGYALNNDFDEAGLELYLKMAENTANILQAKRKNTPKSIKLLYQKKRKVRAELSTISLKNTTLNYSRNLTINIDMNFRNIVRRIH